MARARRRQESDAAGPPTGEVLIVLPSLGYGGVEMGVVALANALTLKGRKVCMLCGTVDEEMRNRLNPAIQIDSRSFRKVRQFFWPLVRHLNAHPNVTVFSVQAHLNVIAILASTFARRHRGRLVVQEVAQLSIPADKGARWRHAMVRLLRQHLYRRADHVVAIGPDIAQALEATLAGRVRIEMMPIPLPTKEILTASQALPAAEHFPEGDDRRLIVGIGRLVPGKRFDVFLEAIAELRQKLPVRAVLIGGGQESDALLDLRDRLGLADDVTFAGQVPNAMPYIARADLMLVPSESEGFGLVALESLALGCPVAPADYGVLARDLCRDLYDCRPPAPGDVVGLTALAIDVLDHPPSKQRLQEYARRYDSDGVAGRYDSLLFDAGAQ